MIRVDTFGGGEVVERSIHRRKIVMSDQQLQKVKVRRLAHVGLWTSDVVAEARFYRQILGFDLRKTVDIHPRATPKPPRPVEIRWSKPRPLQTP